MNPANLILVRGLPGSGKTTFARTISTNGHIYAADDYFMVNGEYKWDAFALPQAHAQCFNRVWEAFRAEATMVIVTNVFAYKKHYMDYVEAANKFEGYRPIRTTVVDLFDGGLSNNKLFNRCVHGVPRHVIAMMRDHWEH